MPNNKIINNKDKSYCDEEEKIILNVNLTGLANSNDVSNSTTIITNALAVLSSHLDTTLATLATSTDVSNSTTTITEAINAIPACDLTGLATSTDVSDVKTDIAGLSTNLANDTASILSALSNTEYNILESLSTCCDNTQAGITGLSTHLDGTLSEVAKTSDLDVLAKTSDLDVLAKTSDLDVLAKTSDIAGLSSHLDTTLATLATSTDVSNSTATITGAINAIPACDLTGLATSNQIDTSVAGLSTHLDTSVAGLSTHLDGTLSEVAKTTDLNVLAKTSDIAGLSSELANNTTSIISALSNTESNILGALSTCCEETQAGISNVASLVEGLYNNACLIKALARTTAAMTPLYKNCNTMDCVDGNDCGIFRDNLSGTKFEFLNGCTTVTGSSIPAMLEITMESAQQSMFDFITNPKNWIGFSC